jgi:AraC-like DNA-binding protein/quercetin dioxygenase-like cupin family protein
VASVTRRFQDPGVVVGWILDDPFARNGDVTHCGATTCGSSHRVPTHAHRGIEIMYLSTGEVTWTIGGSPVRQQAGEVLVVGGGVPHGTAQSAHPPFRALFAGLDAPSHSGPAGELRGMLERAGGSLAPRVAPEFEPILDGLYRIADDGLPRSGAVAATYRELLVRLVCERFGSPPRSNSPAVDDAIRYLQANLDRLVPVPEIARVANLGVRQFSSRFHSETGMTPAAWHLSARLTAAETAVRSPGASITVVAQDFGFSSAQHFSTAFKGVFGRSPGRYRSGR